MDKTSSFSDYFCSLAIFASMCCFSVSDLLFWTTIRKKRSGSPLLIPLKSHVKSVLTVFLSSKVDCILITPLLVFTVSSSSTTLPGPPIFSTVQRTTSQISLNFF
ncbi:hypothetical protein M153_23600010957 [Pseudoloma neurophilia]|uniref:Uncharacterized protein n=1 Tax=Pseudoloma neurophilia TaxID=146866 RepID=A0A0R0M601_9MICR|nr:hypothetical protein M153_23600010957 [Pseudoloma neurophilia]